MLDVCCACQYQSTACDHEPAWIPNAYVCDPDSVVNMGPVRGADIQMRADPLDRGSFHYRAPIAEGCGSNRREQSDGSDVAFHDRRLGRSRPHGRLAGFTFSFGSA
jgi:hypothetical protein